MSSDDWTKLKNWLSDNYELLIALFWILIVWVITIVPGSFPSGTDSPFHYFKSWQMWQFLSKGQFPSWSFWLSSGTPFLQTYSPGYYLLSGGLTLIVGDIGLAMKIITLANLIAILVGVFLVSERLETTSPARTTLIFVLAFTTVFSLVGQHPFNLAIAFFIWGMYAIVNAEKQSSEWWACIAGVLFGTTILTHLVVGYMMGMSLVIIGLYTAYYEDTQKGILYGLSLLIGVGLAAWWLVSALVEYFFLNQKTTHVLQEIFWNEPIILVLSFLVVIPIIYYTLINDDTHNKKFKIAAWFFVFLGAGKYSPLYFIPLFGSMISARVLVFGGFFGSLFCNNRKTWPILLLFVITSSSAIYYLNPSILGTDSKSPISSWNNKGIVEMQNDGTLYGTFPTEFSEMVEILRINQSDGRVIFISNSSNMSPTIQFYRLLFLTGKRTPQGDYPDSSEVTNWESLTKYIIIPYYFLLSNFSELLELTGVRWVISEKIIPKNEPFSLIRQNKLFYLYEATYPVTEIHEANGTIKRSPDRCEISLTEHNGTIIVSESYHPNWKASTGEEELPVTAFRGLCKISEIPQSNHIIILEYKKPIVSQLGIGITIVTILITAIWYSFQRKKKGSFPSLSTSKDQST